MMTPSGFIKPKLGFSIESLVGGRATPPLSEDEEETDSLNNGFVRSHSPAPLGPFFSRALLNNHEEKSPVIQRPQPINGAARRTSTDLESHLPAALQSSKSFGAIPNLLIPPPVGMPSFPHLQGVSLPSHLNPFMMGPAGIPGFGATIPREYPLYPWLLSRHGRVFSQGFPSPEQLAYLLQPFRKPKRVRTAFSPSQLLKLEQAFEKNQYVVGVERKQLAQNLNLSETQVKVWFQNRRTKEKRTQPDEEGDMEDGMKKLNDNEDDEDDDFEESLKKERKNGENKKADLSDDDDEVAKRRKIFQENGSDPKLGLPPPPPPSSSSSSSAFLSAASSFSSASRNLATLSMDGGELISDSIIGQNPFAGISPNETLRAKKIAT